MITNSAFVESEFYLLIAFSLIAPALIYSYLMWRKKISPLIVGLFGVALIVIAGIDAVLLQRLAMLAKMSLSALDDKVFASEISLALYLFPALFAGIGVNIISHVLIRHLDDAERKYEQDGGR